MQCNAMQKSQIFICIAQSDRLNACLQSPDQCMNLQRRDHYRATHWHINACSLLYCKEVCVCMCACVCLSMKRHLCRFKGEMGT